MSGSKSLKASLAAALLVASGWALSFAFDDGFPGARRLESTHFIIYIYPDVNTSTLAKQLNIGPSDKFLAGEPLKERSAPPNGLGDALDALYAEVSNMLDMRLYTYKVNLKVCRDLKQVRSVYTGLFGGNLDTSSFYSYELNTIYITEENLRACIIGHELAHAIISHYFVVAPPSKIHEILSMYVEYQLRKKCE